MARIARLTVTCLSPRRNTALNSPAPQIDHLHLLFLVDKQPSYPRPGQLIGCWWAHGRLVCTCSQSLVGPAWGAGSSTSWHSIGTELTGAFFHILQHRYVPSVGLCKMCVGATMNYLIGALTYISQASLRSPVKLCAQRIVFSASKRSFKYRSVLV